MAQALERIVASLLRRGGEDAVFSGAAVAVLEGAQFVAEASWGDDGTTARGAVTTASLFDLASLTKPVVATVVLRLVETGEIGLEQTLAELLPGAAGRACGSCTVEGLLSHEAGLPAWLPLFEQVPAQVRGTRQGASAVVRLALEASVDQAQRGVAVYSDIGFVLLGAALEARCGQPLDELVTQRVTGPLGLRSLSFRRLERAAPGEGVVATEDCPWRGRLLVGQVHDDNAWASGGVSGQAGLFGNVAEVARFGASWLEWIDRGGLLSRALAQLAVTRRAAGRGLGWDLRSAIGSSAGSVLGPRTFGHLGFTGCSLWADPQAQVAVALLTNRVRYGRQNDKLKAFRPELHDAIARELKKRC